jgi:hypothetical protein
LLSLGIVATALFGFGWLWSAAAKIQADGVNHPGHDLTTLKEPEIRISGSSQNGRLGDHYLMLVNTAIASMIDKPQIAQFDRSNYDGLAVTFSPAYDVGPPPSSEEIQSRIADWKNVTKKDIWPWVFLNRILAADDRQNNPHTQQAYFHRMRGADLDGKVGARNDFLVNWENALRAARNSHTPGIVCDLEFYNDYNEYDPRVLAVKTGLATDDVLAHLRSLGSKMADVAAEQYPDAALWFLFTGFSHEGYKGTNGEHFYLSPTYIVAGLLDEIAARHFQLSVFSGGEVGLGGYCHPSLGQFKDQIYNRNSAFSPFLKKYSGTLELGGTMTLWSERGAKRGWMSEGDCAACAAATVDDLQPYLELLIRSYRYNWVYGSADGGYLAFDPKIAPRFDAVVARAKLSATTPQSR